MQSFSFNLPVDASEPVDGKQLNAPEAVCVSGSGCTKFFSNMRHVCRKVPMTGTQNHAPQVVSSDDDTFKNCGALKMGDFVTDFAGGASSDTWLNYSIHVTDGASNQTVRRRRALFFFGDEASTKAGIVVSDSVAEHKGTEGARATK